MQLRSTIVSVTGRIIVLKTGPGRLSLVNRVLDIRVNSIAETLIPVQFAK